MARRYFTDAWGIEPNAAGRIEDGINKVADHLRSLELKAEDRIWDGLGRVEDRQAARELKVMQCIDDRINAIARKDAKRAREIRTQIDRELATFQFSSSPTVDLSIAVPGVDYEEATVDDAVGTPVTPGPRPGPRNPPPTIRLPIEPSPIITPGPRRPIRPPTGGPTSPIARPPVGVPRVGLPRDPTNIIYFVHRYCSGDTTDPDYTGNVWRCVLSSNNPGPIFSHPTAVLLFRGTNYYAATAALNQCVATWDGQPCSGSGEPPEPPVEPPEEPGEECCPEPVCCPVTVNVTCTQAEECKPENGEAGTLAESSNGEPIPPGSGGGLKQLQGQTVNINCQPADSSCKECVDDPRQLGLESSVYADIREKLVYCEEIEAQGPATGPGPSEPDKPVALCDNLFCGIKPPGQQQ
jgi:hypothetical protein